MKNETRSETRKPCVISLGEYRAKRTTAPPAGPSGALARLQEQRKHINEWVERIVSDVDKLDGGSENRSHAILRFEERI